MRLPPQVEIASYLTNYGHEIDWVLSSEELQKFYTTSKNGVNILVTPCNFNNKIILRTLSTISYAIRRMETIRNLTEEKKYDLIFVRDCLFDSLIALYLKWRYHLSFVLELSNPLEQSWDTYKINHKTINPSYLIHFLYYQIEKLLFLQVMKKANLVLPTTRWMLNDFSRKGIERSKMMDFPNGIYPKRFELHQGQQYSLYDNQDSNKKIIYIGTMQKERNLEILLDAMTLIRSKYSDIQLLMVGDGDDRPYLEEQVKKKNLEGYVQFTGSIHFDKISELIQTADIGISIIPPHKFFKCSSPIKFFEYLAMGKPVVANGEILEQKEIISEVGCGVTVSFSPESIAEGIITLLNNPTASLKMGEIGKTWIYSHRTYDLLAQRLQHKYFEVVKTQP